MNYFTALSLLFIGLKLGGIINWSWWLVLSPLWGFFLVLFIAGVVANLGK